MFKTCKEYLKIGIGKYINYSVHNPLFCRVFWILTQLVMAAAYWHGYSEELNNMSRWHCSTTSLCFCHVPFFFNRFDQLWGICSLEEIVKGMLSKDTRAWGLLPQPFKWTKKKPNILVDWSYTLYFCGICLCRQMPSLLSIETWNAMLRSHHLV